MNDVISEISKVNERLAHLLNRKKTLLNSIRGIEGKREVSVSIHIPGIGHVNVRTNGQECPLMHYIIGDLKQQVLSIENEERRTIKRLHKVTGGAQ